MRRKRKLVFGVGLNDADYAVKPRINGAQVECPYYVSWKDMLKRGYSELYHDAYPTYADVTVCAEWRSFMTFREWMEGEDWEGKALDKDIIISGNREYRPDRCLFVSPAVNNLLCSSDGSRGAYPCGVSNHCRGYRAHMSYYGKLKHLGYFDTVNEAEQVYKKAKKRYIEEVAATQTDARIRDGLLRHADLLV